MTEPREARSADAALTMAVAASMVAAAAGFTRVFAGDGWVGPVGATLAAAHLASWGARRGRLPAWAAAALGVAAVAVVGAVAVLPGTTRHGLPLGATWHAAGAALHGATAALASSTPPVRATHGFVLLAAWGAGACSLVADWAAFRVRSGLQAVAPPIAVYLVTCATGTTRHRVSTTVAVVATCVLVLAVHRATLGAPSAPWLAGRRAALWPTAGAGVGLGAVGVLAAALFVPGPGTTDGHGALGWRGAGGASNDRSVISPVVDLQARLHQRTTTPVFQVTTSTPSYWRLTSLDTFTGVEWESTDSYQGTDGPLPGLPAGASTADTVSQRWQIQDLSSIWMPTALNPVSVKGGGQVSWDPVSGSLLTAKATSNGLRYTTTSTPYLAGLTPAALSGVPLGATDAAHQRYLDLPNLNPAVTALAHRITSGAHSEYQAALALQDYFIDNPAFTYTLNPPDDGFGSEALTTFLFRTHAGYCQQFAGAYSVLARAAGLPTRLAIGFATGTSTGETYQVTNAEAHTWPEVWFGPQLGWLPFEPTKGGFSIPGASGYAGATGGPAPSPSVPATVPATVPTATPVVPAPAHDPRVPDQRTTNDVARSSAHGGRPPTALLVLAAIALAGAAWVAATAAGNARRQRRRAAALAAAPPEARDAVAVLSAWDAVTDTLGLWGVRRRPSETLPEFAVRAGRHAGAVLGDRAAGTMLTTVAATTAEATYREGAIDHVRARHAIGTAARLDGSLQRAAPLPKRLRRLVDLRAAWLR